MMELSSADLSFCENANRNGQMMFRDKAIKRIREHNCYHCAIYSDDFNCKSCAIGSVIILLEDLDISDIRGEKS